MQTLMLLAAVAASVFVVENPKGYNSWPMIGETGGTLVCTYSKGLKHSIGDGERGAYARTSSDGGRTWGEEACLANAPDLGEVPIGKGKDATGAALFWNRCCGSKPHHDLYRTTDGKAFELLASLKLDPHPTQITDIFEVDGKLMSFWFRCSYGDKNGLNAWGTVVSKDGGRTWRQVLVESGLTPAELPTEQAGFYAGNGRVFAIARTEGDKGQFQLTSLDSGKTWKKTRTNIKDVCCSTPSLVYDAETDTIYNYYYQRGAGKLKRRIAVLSDVFDHPTRWPEPDVLVTDTPAPPAFDCGNANAVRLGDKHVISYYTGKYPDTGVFVCVVDAGKARDKRQVSWKPKK